MPSVLVALVVALGVFAITFFLFRGGMIPSLVRATKEHEQQLAEVQKKRKRRKKQTNGDKIEQNYTSKMEEQGDEQLSKDSDMFRETVIAPTQHCEKRDQHFNHQSRTKDVQFQHVEVKGKHLKESPAQNKTKCEERIAQLSKVQRDLRASETMTMRQHELVIAKLNKEHEAKSRRHQLVIAKLNEEHEAKSRQHKLVIAKLIKEHEAKSRRYQLEDANLEKEIAKLKQDRKAQDEQRVPKLVQNSRSKEEVQPGGEDQTGVSAIQASKGTLGMEKVVRSSESEATTNKMLVAARTKPNNSEDENKSVEDGLKKDLEPFSRKSSFSSEASVHLDDLSGVVAEGLQPLSDAKDATITTQIDKEINKEPTGIDSKVTSERALEVRQLVSDAALLLTQWEKEIEPHFQDEAALRGGLLPKSKYPFSAMLKALWIIKLDKPKDSDIDNPKWLERHHLSKFKQESGKKWLKENLDSPKADERLNILEKAATAWRGKAGRSLVSLFKVNVRTNHQLHPYLDLDDVILCSKDGTYTFDGEDLGDVVQLLAVELKKPTS